jgi:protein-disulfide isomerase
MSEPAKKIVLFISKESIYFKVTMEEFQTLLAELEKLQPFTSEIIDVNESPEKAEEYKVDALPTIIIGDKRFIGKPKSKDIVNLLSKKSQHELK